MCVNFSPTNLGAHGELRDGTVGDVFVGNMNLKTSTTVFDPRNFFSQCSWPAENNFFVEINWCSFRRQKASINLRRTKSGRWK